MSSKLCPEYTVLRNHMSTDVKPRYFPTSRGVGGVVSFDTSQLDSSAQPCRIDDAYKKSLSPLHQNMDVEGLHILSSESQDIPNQCWNRGSYNGIYPPRANLESYGNHHTYPSPNFGADNEVSKPAHHWRRKLNKGANIEQPIIQDISFSNSEQRYYHGGYRMQQESYQNCHPYQSHNNPQYHPMYHPHLFNSVPTQAQHHIAHGPCNEQSPYETNRILVRPSMIDACARENGQHYPSKLPYHSTPQHPHYVQSPPQFLGRNYSSPNLEYCHQHPSDHIRPEQPIAGQHSPVSRKRKIEDSSCAEEDKKAYMVYADRCMSPVSDMSVSSATSQELGDQFLAQFQIPNNIQKTPQSVSVPTIEKQQNTTPAVSDYLLSNEASPGDCEHPAFLQVPRIERGESYYPYFNFDKAAGPVRTVTPMKLPQEGGREYTGY